MTITLVKTPLGEVVSETTFGIIVGVLACIPLVILIALIIKAIKPNKRLYKK